MSFCHMESNLLLHLPLHVTDVIHPAKIIAASPTFIASLSQTHMTGHFLYPNEPCTTADGQWAHTC